MLSSSELSDEEGEGGGPDLAVATLASGSATTPLGKAAFVSLSPADDSTRPSLLNSSCSLPSSSSSEEEQAESEAFNNSTLAGASLTAKTPRGALVLAGEAGLVFGTAVATDNKSRKG